MSRRPAKRDCTRRVPGDDDLLAMARTMTNTEIAQACEVSRSTVTHALRRVMVRKGLTTLDRPERSMAYAVPAAMPWQGGTLEDAWLHPPIRKAMLADARSIRTRFALLKQNGGVPPRIARGLEP